jgi:peptide/nickel transport system substrate-binding protein
MTTNHVPNADSAAGGISRRRLVQGAAALGMAAAMPGIGSRAAVARAAAQEAGGPGPAADRLTFSAFNVDQAPIEITQDKMDLYLYGLKAAGAEELAGAEGVRVIQAPASTLSLILNPAPAREGELNPFAIPEIRRAVQYLVDREFIAGDIYGGRAVPMISHVSPLDYDELTIFETVRRSGIRYDPEFANALIAEQMEAAGATRDQGVWTFEGRPVMLKIIVRVEDERRDVGDLFRAALEGAGFQVQPVYQPFGPATLAVYASDPLTFQWHAYTEGWGRTAPDRYDFGTINQMYAPWLGNMPGWLETGFWQYENEELDRVGQQLYRGEFGSRDERDELYRQMTSMGLGESVRLWLATALQTFPARNELENLNVDIVGGAKPASPARRRFGLATSGSGPIARSGTRSAASVTLIPATSTRIWSTRRSSVTPLAGCRFPSVPPSSLRPPDQTAPSTYPRMPCSGTPRRTPGHLSAPALPR